MFIRSQGLGQWWVNFFMKSSLEEIFFRRITFVYGTYNAGESMWLQAETANEELN